MKKIIFFVILLTISCQKNAEKPILKETGFSKENFITPEYEIYNILIEKINTPVLVYSPFPIEMVGCDFCTLDTLSYTNVGVIFDKYMYQDFIKKENASKKFETKQIKAGNFIPHNLADSLFNTIENITDVYFSSVALNKEKNKAFVKSRTNYVKQNTKKEFISYDTYNYYFFEKINNKWIIAIQQENCSKGEKVNLNPYIWDCTPDTRE